MSHIEFQFPPVVEIVAEVRWDQSQYVSGEESSPDEFFNRFGSEVFEAGFNRAERLLPAGFNLPLYTPVLRYRQAEKSKQGNLDNLYQIGSGIFSAHALPPYETWETFSPIILNGLDYVEKAKNDDEKNAGFSQISLRYINAFKENLLKKFTPGEFMQKVLGFNVSYPEVFMNGVDLSTVRPVLQTAFTLPNGMKMNLAVGHALVDGEMACALDMLLTHTGKIANADAPKVLEEQHNLIRDFFLSITGKIHSDMTPKA